MMFWLTHLKQISALLSYTICGLAGWLDSYDTSCLIWIVPNWASFHIVLIFCFRHNTMIWFAKGAPEQQEAVLNGLLELFLCDFYDSLTLFFSDSGIFLIYSSGLQGCLETKDFLVKISKTCNTSSPAQKWKWVSRNRLFNIGTLQCLAVSWKSENTSTTAPVLATYECDRESVNMRWNCRSLGDQLSQYLNPRLGNWSVTPAERGDQARGGQWKVYGHDEDLCSKPYSGKACKRKSEPNLVIF